MFQVREYASCGYYYLDDGDDNCMHRDGEIIPHAREYWPTREQARTVLDKFRPKHVWKHGDIFHPCGGQISHTMMYVDPNVDHRSTQVVYVHEALVPTGPVKAYLSGAVFLFNIEDALSDRGIL